MKKIIVFLALFVFSTHSYGYQITVKHFKYAQEQGALKEGNLAGDIIFSYLNGVAAGVFIGTSIVYTRTAKDGAKKLYCPPEGLKLNHHNYAEILSEGIKTKQIPYITPIDLENWDIGQLLALLLLKKFDCTDN